MVLLQNNLRIQKRDRSYHGSGLLRYESMILLLQTLLDLAEHYSVT